MENNSNNGINLTCDVCNNPQFICKCETYSWLYFDKIINNSCKGKIENDIKWTTLNISTMTICFNFTQVINLTLLKERLPKSLTVNYNPGSRKSKVPKKKGTDSFYNSFDIKITIIDHENNKTSSNISIFIFPNGKAKAAGIKTINTINLLLDELIEIVKYIPESVENPETLKIENMKIQMICSDFKIKPVKEDSDGWCIKQEELKNILVKQNLSATFSALSRYPGINLKIESIIEPGKQVSLLIFRSGSIIITGGKNAKDISNCYNYIVNVIRENSNVLFYYDINEEIKQRKKNKINKINKI
jgi:TATA-box binding protein (TBP) (component of TFIID and TFIIIB)